MIMKRPSGQARLLLLGLLRTVSALATEPRIMPTATAAYGSMAAVSPPAPQITLRLARRTDLPSMQRCNLASLPENYNQQFFANHMRQWPELTIVAECSDPTTTSSSLSSTGGGGGVGYSYNPFPTAGQSDGTIVAYVLGKVEERPIRTEPASSDGWRPDPYAAYDTMPPAYTTERVGHVTSLAVLESFRRQGLAREMMNQLHHHLEVCYGVDSVGLHVRRSNEPAEKLYKRFGYEASERIPGYYQDGEDAYFMKKQLSRPTKQQTTRLFGGFRKSKPWESGPDTVRLPRLVGNIPTSTAGAVHHNNRSPADQGSAPELLTGSM